jgi:hypothetical protein
VAETVRWIKTIHGHLEGIGMDMADDGQRDLYRKVMKALTPHLEKIEQTTIKVLVPALKESGGGLVIDSKWSSKQWHIGMPRRACSSPATPPSWPRR